MARKPAQPDETPEDSGETSGEAKPEGARRNKRLVTGAAIGIGSAALVAALLYANRARKTDRS